MDRAFENLIESTAAHRAAVLCHPVYAMVSDLRSLRVFMEHHVVAVWDFMTLLKSLQRRLTCVDLPWRPVPDTNLARVINDIVTVEESDEIAPGKYLSHFEIYRAAMAEAGASGFFVEEIARRGIEAPSVPVACRKFVKTTFGHAEEPIHVTAAAFLQGREDLVPAMFERMSACLPARGQGHFQFYLRRHMQVDGDLHGPMARDLLRSLCRDDLIKWEDARRAAIEALEARHALWDAIATAISQQEDTRQ